MRQGNHPGQAAQNKLIYLIGPFAVCCVAKDHVIWLLPDALALPGAAASLEKPQLCD